MDDYGAPRGRGGYEDPYRRDYGPPEPYPNGGGRPPYDARPPYEGPPRGDFPPRDRGYGPPRDGGYPPRGDDYRRGGGGGGYW